MLKTLSKFVLGLVLFIALWSLTINTASIPAYLLPSPSSVWKVILSDIDSLLRNSGLTFLMAILGSIVATIISIIMCSTAYFLNIRENFFAFILIFLQSIPVIALVPLLNIWFQSDVAPKIIIASLIGLFPLAVSMIRSIGSANRELLIYASTLGLSKSKLFLKIVVPCGLSGFFTGMRVGFPLAVVGAIVAEYAGSDNGIGYYMILAQRRLEIDALFAGIFFASAIGVLSFLCVLVLERIFIPWQTRI